MNRLPRSGFLYALAAAFLLLAQPASAGAASAAEAGKYIEDLGNQALAVISSKSSKPSKQTKLEAVFNANVDFPWVGKFVMGRFWRQASDKQKTRYLKEYQKFLTLHYTSRFTDYTGGSFKVTGSRDEGENEYTVSTQMDTGDPKGEAVLVDYRVRAEGGSFKIFDVIVEGVSLITTQRSEFAAVINAHGIDYLIDQLAVKSDLKQ